MELVPFFKKSDKKQRVPRERKQGGNDARYYRNKYKKFCRLKYLAPSFEIHHLDHNWKNDEIRNLVALPKELHEMYHQLEKKKYLVYKNGQFFINARFLLESSKLSKIVVDTYAELIAWISFRDYLTGEISLNLYNLSYEEHI